MRPIRILIAGLLLLAAGIAPAFAQPQPAAVLTGTVVDDSTGTPLAGVNVFIASSMIGTTTDGEGRYRLEKVPLGAQRLYVSSIGFEPQARDIILRESKLYTFDFRMAEAVAELGEITVEAKGDKRWARRLERFTSLFIGETPNAQETKILNPEVLDFADKGGTLLAFAGEILVIENRALGYKVQYFLKDFAAEPTRTRYDGEPLFEELTPANAEEAAMWEENRRKAFYGSVRHFFLAVLSGRAKEHGFETFQRAKPAGAAGQGTFSSAGNGLDTRVPYDPASMLKPGDNPNEKVLDFEGAIEIVFKGELEDESYARWQQQYGGVGGKRNDRLQRSLIWQEDGPTIIDYKGDILNPYGVTVSGYFAFERIADELPKEYRPSR
ncbi:MAG: carboxypeptidase-like regulatory domain-containing protein [Rhodothermales bacterium]